MSREIKFRAFVKDENRIIDNIVFHEFEDINTQFKDDELIFMQYTGLKDKNSVEVYQNDIGIDKFGRKVIVKWNEEECCFALLTIDDVVKDEWNFCLRDLVEVIGNIYENENLLKE